MMKSLGKFPDVTMPSKNFESFDDELLKPRMIGEIKKGYARLCGHEITTSQQLIDSFFRYNAAFSFCGFKSMPERHKDYTQFIQNPGIKFITLSRLDVVSTVASFIAAMKFGSWERKGERPDEKWIFRPQDDAKLVRRNLAYVHTSLAQLDMVPNAIRITYEDLCQPAFHCSELDDYFDRPVRIENPKQPTHGEEHVTNWEEFKSYVDRAFGELKRHA
jgi:hypothetical protein